MDDIDELSMTAWLNIPTIGYKHINKYKNKDIGLFSKSR